ncbi:hypothetical protein BBJ29_007129 [Phytophthora kernoviae]|uniref:Uncharacterized protein n=1 Tax=Phytophthora kernoviae TaxID=325452 RepID=A0A3F2RWY3_9STRA|nr:hypothetical protein BBJ29_007129 [Phytophthora kernoviae]RLN65865.1 hypothetical protein BBP00_00002598 [Phytophthora kernoviae]
MRSSPTSNLQDTNSLAGAHEVLQAAAALPLAEPSVQRACLHALRELGAPTVHDANALPMPPSFVYDSGSASNSKWSAADTTFPTSRPRKQMMVAVQKEKSSGRAKGVAVGSLHHCKEFLLACANEIHELEDEHPARFDYAEDTASSSKDYFQPTKPQTHPKCNHCGTNFDYASMVPDSSAFSVESYNCNDEGDDGTRADQGSQFSEILHRAEYMSDVEDELSDVEVEPTSRRMQDYAIRRQVLRSLHTYVQSRRQRRPGRLSMPDLAVKFRVFEALKLQAHFTRKRLAFQHLKTGLRSRHQQRPATTKAATLAKSQRPVRLYDVVLQTLVFRHSDVLVLLLALAFLANLPAKYIM